MPDQVEHEGGVGRAKGQKKGQEVHQKRKNCAIIG